MKLACAVLRTSHNLQGGQIKIVCRSICSAEQEFHRAGLRGNEVQIADSTGELMLRTVMPQLPGRRDPHLL